MLERVIVAKIKKALEAEGAKCLKTHGNPYLEAGTLDLLVGHPIWGPGFLEVKKSEKEKVTELQKLRLKQWAAVGFKTGVVWSVKMALEVMRR